jgi:hypothetical protein
MDSTQRNETKRIMTLRSSKWTAGTMAMLLSASLVLAACGDSSEPVVVSTPVATMAAETPAAAETPTAEETEAEATEEATEEPSEEVTDSETMTDTEGMDDSDAMTDTEAMDDSESMTDTEGMDDSEATPEATPEATEEPSEEVTGTETMTDTEGVDDSESMTDTEGMDDSETMTETGSTGSDAATTAGASTTGDAAATDTGAMMGVSGVDAKQYVRASTLLDYDFENLDGEVSGDLEDLLIDVSTGRVLFASIEYGGVLDLGDKDIVVPLNAFTVGEEGELVLNIDETSLENYPDVGNDWPNLDDAVWDDDVNAYWNEAGINVGEGYSEVSNSVGWASDIIGHNIADLGVGAGSILDVLVNLGTGRAQYVIVDYGEGLDTDPYIIPMAAFDVTDWDGEFAYSPDFTPDLLDSAPHLDRETYPEGTPFDTDFGDNIESTWNDLGFSNDLNNDGEID